MGDKVSKVGDISEILIYTDMTSTYINELTIDMKNRIIEIYKQHAIYKE